MNIRPSTPQILRDLAEELNREIMPLLSDSTDQIRLHMIAAVLGQCAVRSGTEIALMKAETDSYVDYARAVSAATGDALMVQVFAHVDSGAVVFDFGFGNSLTLQGYGTLPGLAGYLDII